MRQHRGKTHFIGVSLGAAGFSKGKGQIFWHYAKVELKPPTMNEFPQIQDSINKIVSSYRTKKFLTLPVKEVVLNSIVCAEVFCLFFIGEIIGKRNMIGYYIPGAWTIKGEDQRVVQGKIPPF